MGELSGPLSLGLALQIGRLLFLIQKNSASSDSSAQSEQLLLLQEDAK